MSVVAAKVYKDKIVMAADSIIVNNWDSKRNDTFSKIISVNDMIIGSCGNAEDASLMWVYCDTHKPASATEKDILNFIVEFKKWKSDYNTCSNNNSYLMAYKGHLFEIEGVFVNEIANFTAIGAGMDFANAALYLDHSPVQAVKVACALSCYVCEPIVSFEQKRE